MFFKAIPIYDNSHIIGNQGIYRESLKDRVTKIRNDSDKVNSFISEFKPFIFVIADGRLGGILFMGKVVNP